MLNEVVGERGSVVADLFELLGAGLFVRETARDRLLATFVQVGERVLPLGRLVQQQRAHALPVLEHVVRVPHGVHQIGGVVVYFALDQKLHQQLDKVGVGRVFGGAAHLHQPTVHFDEQFLVEKLTGGLGHRPVRVVHQLVQIFAVAVL
ncbi:hypothetical protein BpHYR1_016890 [Brachionus plicatilis]|uniref:Uncharacterized protein n=1 Tax=Brachionus plicatilis TaxID=10195 RepID=A0A3M7RG73_BRAPC|nr:hypothetical protein BpHYR1_016890 [Brachionus plicatilis]